MHMHPTQGYGRWDNADLYSALYTSQHAPGAIGETFAHLTTWSASMLEFPSISAVRALAVYSVDEERFPLLDLDDAAALLHRALRPTDVVMRNRPRTQAIARQAHAEARWSGIGWWSMHRPQWALHCWWNLAGFELEAVEDLRGHPALRDAARTLAKPIDAQMAGSK
jgi:hypothetical protein